MRIGEVAATAGVTAQTIRFYERTGLLPPPQRTPNGYRTYDEQTITRLQFIRNGQVAGLTLLEITAIIDLRGAGTTPCAHVSELLSARLQDVHGRQRELAVLEAELQDLISRGRRLDPKDCTDTEICHLIGPPFQARPPGRPDVGDSANSKIRSMARGAKDDPALAAVPER